MQTLVITPSSRVPRSFSLAPGYFRNSPKTKSLQRWNSLITVNTSQLERCWGGSVCHQTQATTSRFTWQGSAALWFIGLLKIVQYQPSHHPSLSVPTLTAQTESHEYPSWQSMRSNFTRHTPFNLPVTTFHLVLSYLAITYLQDKV